MSRGTQHEWTVRLEDGRDRVVRARLFGKQWTLKAKADDEDEWTEYPEPLLGDLVDLLDVLRRKYQRNRVPWEHVRDLEGMVEKRRGSAP